MISNTKLEEEKIEKRLKRGKKLAKELINSNWPGRQKENMPKKSKNEKINLLPDWVKLSEVLYLNPNELKKNPLNKELFRDESPGYYKELSDDIKKRGIIVPLIAKIDGTILAGNNRLSIAAKLGLKEIPIQKVLSKLTIDEERDFIIKDNLFRRQLSLEDRKRLYKTLSSEERQKIIIKRYSKKEIIKENRGGDRKSLKKGSKTGTPVFDPSSTEKPLYKKISNELGGSEFTAKEDLTKIRKELKKIKNKSNRTALLKGVEQIESLKKKINKINKKIEEIDKNTKDELQELSKQFQNKKFSLKEKRKNLINPLKLEMRKLESKIKSLYKKSIIQK
jgi:hypothetical protein